MKHFFTFCFSILLATGTAFAQPDCTGGRYSTFDLFSDTEVTSGVTFGSNTALGGSEVDLKMDVYEPAGDTDTDRPVVIVAFGGSFIGGDRSQVAFMCEILAKMGYVAVAPDYRVGLFFPSQITTTLAVLRGAHDVSGCVRYLKKTAAEDGNPYGIDCERIIVGGISAGAIAASKEHIEQIWKTAINFGGNLSDQTVWLLERSLKTLNLRVKEQTKNAQEMAEYLENNQNINRVYYPGLKSHPHYELAKKQMKGFGAMLSFDYKNNTPETATKILENTHYFSLAESLGGVESLIGHPATMTHASVPWEERQKVGLTDSLIRVSVGVEDVDDLIEDLEQAINAIDTTL